MIIHSKAFQLFYRFIRYLLIPLIPIYLLLFFIKRVLTKQRRFDIPVICIGNLTTGGTGKTPTVIYLAELLQKEGFKPGIVSRGYRGSGSKSGAIVTDGNILYLTPMESGDEPYLMVMKLRDIPVAIGRDRGKSVENLIRRFDIDIVIMDNGFQNRSVYKDLSILIIDAMNPFGNRMLLPAGDLREPRSSLKRGDIIIISRSDFVSEEELKKLEERIKRLCHHKPIFKSKYTKSEIYRVNDSDSPLPVSVLSGKRLLLITGIANPNSFLDLVKRYKPQKLKILSLPDHYEYRVKDIDNFIEESKEYDNVIVTEKDFVKLERYTLNDKFYILKVSIEVKDEDLFYRDMISILYPDI